MYKIDCEDLESIHVAEDEDQWWAFVCTPLTLVVQ